MIKTSQELDAFAEAFAKAQGELVNPPKSKVNPHFNSRYVDLSDGLDVIRKTFSKNGLAVIQGTAFENDITILTTRILHKSGQWMEWNYPVSGLDTHQKMGSAMTYARRYALFSIVGVAGEDDDDGNAASAPTPPKPAKKMAEPGFTPEQSATERQFMLDELAGIDSLQTLTTWAAENRAAKNKLTPPDQTAIADAFRAVQAKLK